MARREPEVFTTEQDPVRQAPEDLAGTSGFLGRRAPEALVELEELTWNRDLATPVHQDRGAATVELATLAATAQMAGMEWADST
jgi:hypothetical protein